MIKCFIQQGFNFECINSNLITLESMIYAILIGIILTYITNRKINKNKLIRSVCFMIGRVFGWIIGGFVIYYIGRIWWRILLLILGVILIIDLIKYKKKYKHPFDKGLPFNWINDRLFKLFLRVFPHSVEHSDSEKNRVFNTARSWLAILISVVVLVFVILTYLKS